MTLGKASVCVIKFYELVYPEHLTVSHLLPSSVNGTCSGVKCSVTCDLREFNFLKKAVGDGR